MKKILIFTFIGFFGLLAAANVLMSQQTKQLSDITLTVYQAQAGDDEGGGEGGGEINGNILFNGLNNIAVHGRTDGMISANTPLLGEKVVKDIRTDILHPAPNL